jgi:hypothetical protein
MLRFLLSVAAAVPALAFAAGVAQSVRGDVQVGGAALAEGKRIEAPAAISTGPGAQVSLRFDDQMQIVLGENTLLRMVDYRYSSSGVTDRAVFELLRGSARVVTGQIAANAPKQFFFRTPQTQLMVERPADFTVALVNPAYINVKSGALVSSNGWGNVSLNAGSTSAVASNAAAPAAISASALPANVASILGNLSVAQLGAPVGGASSGFGFATAGAAQTTTQWVILGIVVAGAVAILATQDDDNPAPATTHH